MSTTTPEILLTDEEVVVSPSSSGEAEGTGGIGAGGRGEETVLSSSSDMSEPSLVQQPSMIAAAQREDEEGHKTATVLPAATIPSSNCASRDETTTTTTKTATTRKTNSKHALMVRILRWYVRFSGSAYNQDKLLKILQYSLKVCFQQHAWSQKIANEITMARYVTRLVGWPVALEAAWHNSWAVVVPATTAPSSDVTATTTTTTTTTTTRAVLHKWLGRIMAYSMVLYYPTEHLAYALWMKPPPSTTPTTACSSMRSTRNICHWPAETWSYWSNRCWLLYIGAEMVQSVLQLQQDCNAKMAPTNDPNVAATTAAATTNIQLSLARNALMVLPCLHWSRSDWDTTPFFLPTATINWLLWTESILTMYQAWRNSWE